MKLLKSGQDIIWWHRCWLATVQKARKHTASLDKTSHDLATITFSDPISYPHPSSFIYSVGCLPLTKTASESRDLSVSLAHHIPNFHGKHTNCLVQSLCLPVNKLTERMKAKPTSGAPLARERWSERHYSIFMLRNFRLTPPKFYCLTSSVKTSKGLCWWSRVKNHLAMQGTWVWTLIKGTKILHALEQPSPCTTIKHPNDTVKIPSAPTKANEAR